MDSRANLLNVAIQKLMNDIRQMKKSYLTLSGSISKKNYQDDISTLNTKIGEIASLQLSPEEKFRQMIQLLANLFTAQEAIYKIKKQKDNASSSFTNLLRTSNSSNTQIIPFYEELNTKLKKHHYTRMLGLILRENYQHKALVQYFPVSEALYETLCQLNVPKRPGYDEFNFTETKKPDIKSGPTR